MVAPSKALARLLEDWPQALVAPIFITSMRLSRDCDFEPFPKLISTVPGLIPGAVELYMRQFGILSKRESSAL